MQEPGALQVKQDASQPSQSPDWGGDMGVFSEHPQKLSEERGLTELTLQDVKPVEGISSRNVKTIFLNPTDPVDEGSKILVLTLKVKESCTC